MEKIDITELQEILEDTEMQIQSLEANLILVKANHEKVKSEASSELKEAIAEISSYKEKIAFLKKDSKSFFDHCTNVITDWLQAKITEIEDEHRDYFLGVCWQQYKLEKALKSNIQTRECLNSKIELMQR